jgi:glycosyltransferase involved in cell wall biosynthesis
MARQDHLISVIMACHNSSRFLDEAVTSVLGQTHSELELIVIDDSSTDDTLEIANRYQSRDTRVTVLALPTRSGPAAARNAGIRAARGKWLGILDSDDVAERSRFEEQLRVAEDHRELVMIGSDSLSIDDASRELKTNRYPTTHRGLVRRLERMGALPPHSSLIYERQVVSQLSAFNPKYAQSEDYDLWLRLSETGNLASVDKPLVRIRKHASNMSDSQGGTLQTRFGIIAAVCHFLRVNRFPDPSGTNSEPAWQEFASWVDTRIREDGVLERRDDWTNARASYLNAGSRVSGLIGFAGLLLRSRQAGALLREKLFGFSLAEQLAHEWMKRPAAAGSPPFDVAPSIRS